MVGRLESEWCGRDGRRWWILRVADRTLDGVRLACDREYALALLARLNEHREETGLGPIRLAGPATP